MKRTTTAFSAFAAGAALLLAGCGSDTAGTAAPASAASQASSAAAPTEMSDTGSVEAPATDESSSSEETSSEDTSSSAETSSEDTSSSEETSSEDTSSSEETSSEDTSSSEDTAGETTIGNGGDLDAQTTTWFDSYCTGLAPVTGLMDDMKDLDTSDPKKMFKTLSTSFSTMGAAFTDAAEKLDGAPAPTFDGGEAFATKILAAFKELGPKFSTLGEELAKADPSDPKSMEKIASLGTDMKSAAEPLQELSKLKIDAGTQAAILAIPSCKSLGGA